MNCETVVERYCTDTEEGPKHCKQRKRKNSDLTFQNGGSSDAHPLAGDLKGGSYLQPNLKYWREDGGENFRLFVILTFPV